MEYLSKTEQDKLIKGIMRKDGFLRDNESRIGALKSAAEKFGLKVKVSKKGTAFETIYLNTGWNNCDEVQDYISSLGVSINIVNDRVQFRPNY